MAKRIVISQRRLTHYRAPLFARLREELAARGMELDLLVGEGTAAEAAKGDAGELPWAQPVPTRYWLGGRVCWQPVRRLAQGADLVVVTQENRLIDNHLHLVVPRAHRLAFWGHGANLQSTSSHGLKERFKRWTTRQVDWWFGYTDLSLSLVSGTGFPGERVTVLNNAIDTTAMAAMRERVDGEWLAFLRRSLGLTSSRVGVYVGSLYTEKRIEFMLAAARTIRDRVPDFEFLIVGGGEQAGIVEAFCAVNSWAKYLGVRKGQDKVDVLSLARVFMHPGALGLAVLDAFVCKVPLVTTRCGLHGPEVAYLQNGRNSLIAEMTLDDYVDAVYAVLTNDRLHARLTAGCRDCADLYTLEHMVQRFADGIERCLALPRYRMVEA